MTILLFLLSLLLAQQPGRTEFGTMSGQLRDVNGAPAAGIRVFVMPAQADFGGAGATTLLSNISQTGSDGRYRLDDVLPGRYLIVAGALASPTFYPGVTTRDQGRAVTITARQTLTNLDFMMTPASSVKAEDLQQPFTVLLIRTGIVRVADGGSLPAGYFRLRVGIDGDFTRMCGATGSGPWFSVPTLDPGPHVFTLGPLPSGYYLKSMTSGNVDLTTAPLIVPANSPPPPLEIVLTKTRPAGRLPGMRVSGRITNVEFPLGSDFPLVLKNVSHPATGCSSDQTVGYVMANRKSGAFEIEGLPPGRYTLEDQLNIIDPHGKIGFDVAGSDVTGLELRIGKPELPATPVSITSIPGTVEVNDGTIPEFEITFAPTRAGAVTHAVAVSRGEFSIPLPTGEYRVSIAALPQGYNVVSVTAGPLDLTEPFLVTDRGIADRFTGTPVRSASPTSAVSAGIVVRLTVPSSGK